MHRLKRNQQAFTNVEYGLKGEDLVVDKLKSLLGDEYKIFRSGNKYDSSDIKIVKDSAKITIQLETAGDLISSYWKDTKEVLRTKWQRGLSIPLRKIFYVDASLKAYCGEFKDSPYGLYLKINKDASAFFCISFNDIKYLWSEKLDYACDISHNFTNQFTILSNTNDFFNIKADYVLNDEESCKYVLLDDWEKLRMAIIKYLS